MSSVQELLASLPLRAALLTDQEGVVLLRAGAAAAGSSGDVAAAELDLQRMAATFAQTAEHAGKLGMGKSRHATAFYGTLHRPHCRRPRACPMLRGPWRTPPRSSSCCRCRCRCRSAPRLRART